MDEAAASPILAVSSMGKFAAELHKRALMSDSPGNKMNTLAFLDQLRSPSDRLICLLFQMAFEISPSMRRPQNGIIFIEKIAEDFLNESKGARSE